VGEGEGDGVGVAVKVVVRCSRGLEEAVGGVMDGCTEGVEGGCAKRIDFRRVLIFIMFDGSATSRVMR
jgi:hypothetical protein